jgi:hypothetical protein
MAPASSCGSSEQVSSLDGSTISATQVERSSHGPAKHATTASSAPSVSHGQRGSSQAIDPGQAGAR